jgi:hypothetical protein
VAEGEFEYGDPEELARRYPTAKELIADFTGDRREPAGA